MHELIKKDFKDGLRSVLEDYITDIRALGDEGMAFAPGGQARRGYDYTYEVGFVNLRIATRLSGGDPGPWPIESGYLVAPEEFRNVEKLVAYLTESVQAMTKAIDGVTQEFWAHEFQFGPDVNVTAFQQAVHAIDHMTYHCGQINLVTMMRGAESA